MNSVPNSDSEIVLSPKTGWVHSVHPQPSLRAQAEPRPSEPGRIVAAATGRVVGTVAVSQALSRVVSQARQPCRGRMPRASTTVSWPVSRHAQPLMP